MLLFPVASWRIFHVLAIDLDTTTFFTIVLFKALLVLSFLVILGGKVIGPDDGTVLGYDLLHPLS